jgi:hypothetical protein
MEVYINESLLEIIETPEYINQLLVEIIAGDHDDHDDE